jgi:molybdate transport system regulatory protein
MVRVMSAAKPHLWIRVIIPGAGAIGPGKIDLLSAIDEQHSISAAARKLGMSYRRAWMLLDETRRAIGTDVVATFAGGAQRGGAKLTDAGRKLIGSYERICATANRAAAPEMAGLAAAKPKPSAKPASKRKRGAAS